MQQEMVYSAEQLARLQEKLAGVKEELKREEKTAVPDIGDNSYIRVSDDAMTVWLLLGQPPETSTGYETKNILAYLKDQGITYGVREDKINDMLIRRTYGEETEIAAGIPMVEGTDGYYEYKFSPESHRAPKVLPDGSVDYTSMHMLQNVRAGDTLAIYHHAVQGQDGCDVYGKALKPAVAKEQRPLRGRNISNQENPDVYVSLIDGKVEVKDDRIDIQNTHEIQGDVDLIIGKIEFFGDIIINGNVEAGVVLRAGRNIVIRGPAEAVNMFAGGDIILERGVQGGQKAKLSARGNVFAEFIEHCTVEAGGDVQANALLGSKVLAGGMVTLTGKKGRIIGGYTHGMKGIQAVSIGNLSEIRTIVHAGFEAKTYEELLRLSGEEQEVSENLKSVLEEMALIIKNRQQKGGNIPKAVEAKLPVLNQKKDELFAKLDQVRSDITFTKELLEKGRGAKIEVNGPIYRGVIISIENMQMPVEESTSFMRYQNKGGLLDSSVMVYK